MSVAFHSFVHLQCHCFTFEVEAGIIKSINENTESTVGVATVVWMVEWGKLVLFPAGRNIFLSRWSTSTLSPKSPLTSYSFDLGTSSRGIKRLRNEVGNVWSYNFIPSYVFIAWCLIKLWKNCTFFLTFCWPCISVYLSQQLTNLMHKVFVLQ